MACYASTIVRIKYVKKYEKEGANYIRVWAIGGYPIEHEDNNFEITLFVLINIDERDPETQAIFEKDNFYCVGMTISTSTHLNILNKVTASNKCPLKQKKYFNNVSTQAASASKNSVRSKLYTMHQNICENFEEKLENENLPSKNSDNFYNKSESISPTDSYSSKHVKVENDDDKKLDYEIYENDDNLTKNDQEKNESKKI
ncbi:hypothetical protein C2G38_2183524 [Gigaspora rosea]|uniref:Uncharacterized protein n=1 Tax=Gigaspora rosea TaxID=44941 RepID=A0A397VHN9_9GLOM|nr:hypothetical protein C2G38_2183524 [Gigaspora rosea]CAG8783170.1 23181_t:CDS:2 [Gigaspora rosea]